MLNNIPMRRYMDFSSSDTRHDPNALERLKSDALIGNRDSDVDLGRRFNKSNQTSHVLDKDSGAEVRGLIVTKTDLRGTITYCNDAFSKMCGWSKEQLLISNHNLVRHKDMPMAVFKLLWDTIRDKKEFYGYVKNLHKNGSYYWVLAYVTPDLDETGEIEGYTSYRKFAAPLAIDTVTPIYEKLLAVEQNADIEHSTEFLLAYLKAQGFSSYDQFIFDLQMKANASMMN